jgi:hypothetical protein
MPSSNREQQVADTSHLESVRLLRALVEIGPQRLGREGRCAVCGVWRSRGGTSTCPWERARQWLVTRAPTRPDLPRTAAHWADGPT